MPFTSTSDVVKITRQRGSAIFFISLFLVGASAASVWAHAGHGDEFHQSESAQSAAAVKLDPVTRERLGMKVEPVTRRHLALGIKTTGQIETLPNQRVEVTTPVGGTLLKLLVNPGDRVEAGQPVAVMTSSELAELRTTALDRQTEAIASVQEAEADLRLAEENYQQQQKITASEVQEARVALSFAQERYDRDRELVQSGALPRRQALESEAALATAKANLAKTESRLSVSEAQAQLQRARSAVQVAQQRVALSGETYQTRLRQLGTRPNQDGTITITAPIAGVVAEPAATSDRAVKLGESREDAGEVIFTIVNTSRVQVSANIFEKDIAQIERGQGVRGRISSLPQRTFNGQINVVGSVVEANSRVIPVKAELDNAGGLLKPGMFVELEVLTDRTPTAVLAIPKSAVVETTDKRQLVFVQNGTVFEPVEISLGQESGDVVEVTSGLFEGDQVVTQRANQLYAQSLRGGSQPQASESPPEAVSPQAQTVPWWWMIPATGAIAASTFWAGAWWSTRREARLVNNFSDHSSDSERDLYLPPMAAIASHDPSLDEAVSRHPVKSLESAAKPHQSH